VIVRCVDIGGTVDHHWLKFLFIANKFSFFYLSLYLNFVCTTFATGSKVMALSLIKVEHHQQHDKSG